MKSLPLMKLFHKKPISCSPVKSFRRKYNAPIFNVAISPVIWGTDCIGISIVLRRSIIVVLPTPSYPTRDIVGGNLFCIESVIPSNFFRLLGSFS